MKSSKYLQALGSGLLPEIHIFWTGSKVVSENIDKEEMIAVNRVLQRKPIIWDNLHANDYDQQRMFLGKSKFIIKESLNFDVYLILLQVHLPGEIQTLFRIFPA